MKQGQNVDRSLGSVRHRRGISSIHPWWGVAARRLDGTGSSPVRPDPAPRHSGARLRAALLGCLVLAPAAFLRPSEASPGLSGSLAPHVSRAAAAITVAATTSQSAPPSLAGSYDWIEIDFVRPFGLVPFDNPTDAMSGWRRIVEANLAASDEFRIPMESIPVRFRVVGGTVMGAPDDAPPGSDGVVEVTLDQVGDLGDRLTGSALKNMLKKLDDFAPRNTRRPEGEATDAAPGVAGEAALSRQAVDRVIFQLQALINDPLRRPGPGAVAQPRFLIETLEVSEGGPTIGSLFANGPVELDDTTIAHISRAIERMYASEGSIPIEVTARPRRVSPDDPRVLEFAVAFVGPLVSEAENQSQVIEVSGLDVGFLGWATEPGGPATENATQLSARIGLPELDRAFQGRSVTLIRRPDGLLVDWYPDPDGEEVVVPLLTSPDAQYEPPLQLSVAGVQAILDGVTLAVAEAGILGVRSRPDPNQLDLSRGGADVRTPTNSRLAINVEVGVLDDVRSIAVNADAKPDFWIFGGGRQVSSRVDAKEHARIRERFPIERGNVLLSRPVRDYLDLLSRHPSRRVDAAITPPRPTAPPGSAPTAVGSSEPDAATAAAGDASATVPPVGAATAPFPYERLGNVGVDLLIAENNPLLVFVQGSNTGPSSTGEWRTRFGLIHSQLTGNDDILSLDYITSGFDDTQAATGMYDAPLLGYERLRWRVGGYWSEFRAPDLGFGFEDFLGRSWGVQGELAWNFFQYDKLFLDLVGGARFFNTRVDNKTIQLVGEDDFFVPFVGMRLERNTRESRTVGGIIFDLPISSVTANSEEDLVALGTLDPTVNWYKFSWDVEHAFYLEPLFAKPDSDVLLAHEIALRFRGQSSFNGRLIPQEQMVLGGLATVRGYPQSVVAGDTVLVGTAEYRLHFPQLLGIESDPGDLFGRPFRTRPQFAYGTTDWDLIFRGFIDAGVAYTSQPFSFEQDDTLVGAGVGVEFQLFHNFNVRVDWGFALREVPGQVNSGSNRLYFVGTLTF